jgi:hypothetical protein
LYGRIQVRRSFHGLVCAMFHGCSRHREKENQTKNKTAHR